MSTPEPARFLLLRLTITGPGKKSVGLLFEERINVVWGASNSGKSYIVKALDFMSGGKTTLPDIKEAQGYDRCWLELMLPVSGTVTLTRAMKGGDFGLHLGAVDPETPGHPDRTLAGTIAQKARAFPDFCSASLVSPTRRLPGR
jgi:hypothetical protein